MTKQQNSFDNDESENCDDQVEPIEQFVVLYHQLSPEFASSSGRESHWDLMLQTGRILRTWALDVNLIELEKSNEELASTVRVSQLPDHRLKYLDYEGSVSDNRGTVTRLARGTLDWTWNEPDCVAVELDSDELSGLLILSKVSDDQWVMSLTELIDDQV